MPRNRRFSRRTLRSVVSNTETRPRSRTAAKASERKRESARDVGTRSASASGLGPRATIGDGALKRGAGSESRSGSRMIIVRRAAAPAFRGSESPSMIREGVRSGCAGMQAGTSVYVPSRCISAGVESPAEGENYARSHFLFSPFARGSSTDAGRFDGAWNTAVTCDPGRRHPGLYPPFCLDGDGKRPCHWTWEKQPRAAVPKP